MAEAKFSPRSAQRGYECDQLKVVGLPKSYPEIVKKAFSAIREIVRWTFVLSTWPPCASGHLFLVFICLDRFAACCCLSPTCVGPERHLRQRCSSQDTRLDYPVVEWDKEHQSSRDRFGLSRWRFWHRGFQRLPSLTFIVSGAVFVLIMPESPSIAPWGEVRRSRIC